ncbi:MAG: hypothetical protein WC213_00065 [Arenimonas sp.]|jgi:hypothetical protein
MNPVEALMVLIGAAFAVGVLGAAVAVGVSLGLRWVPLKIQMNTLHYKIDPP